MNEKDKRYLVVVFIVITFITAFALVLANLGLFGEAIRESDFAKWGMGAVLGEIVLATLALFKFEFLKEKKEKKMIVHVTFPTKDVDLNVDKCILKIRDKKGHYKPNTTPNLTFNKVSGSWSFQLPEVVAEEDSVSLELEDDNGKMWKTYPFPPFSNLVEASEKGL